MKNFLKKIKEKIVWFYNRWLVIAKRVVTELWLILRPKIINYSKNLVLVVLLWLQRNSNRFLQKYIDKLSVSKDVKDSDYKDYEVYED